MFLNRLTTATFDGANLEWPEHGVLSVKACYFRVSGGANRGHLPLGKVTYASVGAPRVSVIRVSAQRRSPCVSVIRPEGLSAL